MEKKEARFRCMYRHPECEEVCAWRRRATELFCRFKERKESKKEEKQTYKEKEGRRRQRRRRRQVLLSVSMTSLVGEDEEQAQPWMEAI